MKLKIAVLGLGLLVAGGSAFAQETRKKELEQQLEAARGERTMLWHHHAQSDVDTFVRSARAEKADVWAAFALRYVGTLTDSEQRESKDPRARIRRLHSGCLRIFAI